MENLPSEILIHIFSFHQFDLLSKDNSESTDALFELLLNLTDNKSLEIYKGEESILVDQQEQLLNKLFNYYDAREYDKEIYLLYQRYLNITMASIRDEWMSEEARSNIEILFSSAESNWAHEDETYLERLTSLRECIRDGKKFANDYDRIFLNLLILNQTFGIGFLGQFLIKFIHHYPLEYCNLRLVSRQWNEAASNQCLWKVSSGMLQRLLKLRSELEFIRKKLYPRMDQQLSMNADENIIYFSANDANDSGLKRFQTDEYCNIKQRFPILSRYNSK